jgi:23S rRNA (cytosine1962-C5)-methyltransferase
MAEVKLQLKKDLVRSIKRGHPWVYADALQATPNSEKGALARLVCPKNNHLAWGIYAHDAALPFRVLSTDKKPPTNEFLVQIFEKAKSRRPQWPSNDTNAFRLINGEGDRLPGLICDIYNDSAVIQYDGPGPQEFWPQSPLAEWLQQAVPLKTIYLKKRASLGGGGEFLLGSGDGIVEIAEHGAKFKVDFINGQKTGFFLDQRENRFLIRSLAKNRSVLNLFAYTGGFSIAAGLGGAKSVDTVDIAAPAAQMATANWSLNGLDTSQHQALQRDAFEFLEESAVSNQKWDLIIVDPPAFAPSQKKLPKAIESYQALFSKAAQRLNPGGFLACSSCSSHVNFEIFLRYFTQIH